MLVRCYVPLLKRAQDPVSRADGAWDEEVRDTFEELGHPFIVLPELCRDLWMNLEDMSSKKRFC